MSRLSEIEEREQKATKGPWGVSVGFDSKHPNRHGGIGRFYMPINRFRADVIHANCYAPNDILEDYWVQAREDDLQFAAHARSDIPYLLELVQQAREIILEFLKPDNLTMEEQDKKAESWLEKTK